jgi:hypothetical protein
MEAAIEQLDIPPDRSFSYDGRFITSRAPTRTATLCASSDTTAGLADWHQCRSSTEDGRVRFEWLSGFTPAAGSRRNNEMFDVAASDTAAVMAWLDRLGRRH